jgi:hypothetical protein
MLGTIGEEGALRRPPPTPPGVRFRTRRFMQRAVGGDADQAVRSTRVCRSRPFDRRRSCGLARNSSGGSRSPAHAHYVAHETLRGTSNYSPRSHERFEHELPAAEVALVSRPLPPPRHPKQLRARARPAGLFRKPIRASKPVALVRSTIIGWTRVR